MKKQQRNNIIAAAIAVALISALAGHLYNMEQTRQAGFAFGNALFSIQESVKERQFEFSSMVIRLEDNEITIGEFEEFANRHADSLANIILEYDKLEPPPTFASSVELFKISSELQMESDGEYVLWLKTGDNSHKIKSDALIQDAFEYETYALAEFNKAKSGTDS